MIFLGTLYAMLQRRLNKCKDELQIILAKKDIWCNGKHALVVSGGSGSSPLVFYKFAGIAQLAERLLAVQKVASSNLVSCSNNKNLDVVELVNILVLETREWEFESLHLDKSFRFTLASCKASEYMWAPSPPLNTLK